MPPPDTLHQLSARDKALIKRWIEEGAKYQGHWAYLPPQKREPPAVRNLAAARTPVDRFVLLELERRNVAPAPEADRRTLLRRVSLDLIGLPPTPAESRDFVQDARPDAYERVVERLLASPHYGERMAVPWLDVVRFADTVGFHGDCEQNIFPYRDYVVDAFNRNMPFDQFTTEQIAGDLLPNATVEQRIASGFNRLNMMTREGGAQRKEYLAKYAADRVRALATTWLGSTVGCAECHDHKFDPISTRDFYSLAAYFSDIKQWGVYSTYKYDPEPELIGFNNKFPFPPEIEVDSVYLQERLARERRELEQHAAALVPTILSDPAASKRLQAWVRDVALRLRTGPDGWSVAAVDVVAAPAGITGTVLADGSVRFAGPLGTAGRKKKNDDDEDSAPETGPAHVLTLRSVPGPAASIRLELLPDDEHQGRVARGGREVASVNLRLAVLRAGQKEPQPLAIADAYPSHEPSNYYQGTNPYYQSKTVLSVADGWSSAKDRGTERQWADFLLREPLTFSAGDRLIATITSVDVGRIRFSISPFGTRMPRETVPGPVIEAIVAATPTEGQRALQAEWFGRSTNHPGYARGLDCLRSVAECRNGRAYTMVTQATEPRPTRILPRGNWQDDSGPIVLPATLHFLPRLPIQAPRETRLDLAHWLTSRENPLTARTFVNRLWQQFFGTGLSAVVDDLGAQGEWPSHPELLDWLAVEFMERGWDVKAIVRLMVTSATYRQASTDRPELREIDPNNRLLARQNPRRLEAEFVRDNALQAAGLLNLDLGGPGVFPYQPEGYYASMNFPTRDYVAQSDERRYRRGLYMHWQRTFLHPMLDAFDAPSREECTATRSVSSTPQQALTLLNDPTFVEAARGLAEKVLGASDRAFSARLAVLFEWTVGRPPVAREEQSLERFLAAQLRHYAAEPAEAEKLLRIGSLAAGTDRDRTEMAAWTVLARVVLNLHETIVRY
jgi:hypothetical protein